MNRYAILFALAAMTSQASAQGNEMAHYAMEAKKSHNECFFNSAIAQLKLMPSSARLSADVNMIAEQAFAACSTEEQMLATILTRVMQPSNVQIGILGNRTGLKRELNNIFHNPEIYAR